MIAPAGASLPPQFRRLTVLFHQVHHPLRQMTTKPHETQDQGLETTQCSLVLRLPQDRIQSQDLSVGPRLPLAIILELNPLYELASILY
jgi:hypothetical protein